MFEDFDFDYDFGDLADFGDFDIDVDSFDAGSLDFDFDDFEFDGGDFMDEALEVDSLGSFMDEESLSLIDAQPNFLDGLTDKASSLWNDAGIGKAVTSGLSSIFTTAVQKYTNLSGQESEAGAAAKNAATASKTNQTTMLAIVAVIVVLFFAMKKGKL